MPKNVLAGPRIPAQGRAGLRAHGIAIGTAAQHRPFARKNDRQFKGRGPGVRLRSRERSLPGIAAASACDSRHRPRDLRPHGGVLPGRSKHRESVAGGRADGPESGRGRDAHMRIAAREGGEQPIRRGDSRRRADIADGPGGGAAHPGIGVVEGFDQRGDGDRRLWSNRRQSVAGIDPGQGITDGQCAGEKLRRGGRAFPEGRKRERGVQYDMCVRVSEGRGQSGHRVRGFRRQAAQGARGVSSGIGAFIAQQRDQSGHRRRADGAKQVQGLLADRHPVLAKKPAQDRHGGLATGPQLLPGLASNRSIGRIELFRPGGRVAGLEEGRFGWGKTGRDCAPHANPRQTDEEGADEQWTGKSHGARLLTGRGDVNPEAGREAKGKKQP